MARDSQPATAILVCHGIGKQMPFETLDMFVNGIWREAKRRNPDQDAPYTIYHNQNRAPYQDEAWVRSYISLDANSDNVPPIDVYEYYWAHQTANKVTMGNILTWLMRCSSYAVKFYDRNKRLEETLEKGKSCGVPYFNKDGRFKPNAYLAGLLSYYSSNAALMKGVGLVMIVIRWLFLLTNAKNWGPFKLLRKIFITSAAGTLLEDFVGDVVAYTATDRKDPFYGIRNKIIIDLQEQLEGILKNDQYKRVIVAGHSLGSVVAYDVLNRLDRTPLANNQHLPFEKLKGLVTFGSPLDKIAFFFRAQTKDEEWVRRQILNQLYAFKRRRVQDQPNETEIIDGTAHNLKNLTWLNFYHCKDFVSGHLDFYDLDEDGNVEITTAPDANPLQAHGLYWSDTSMYDRIFTTFFDRPHAD